MRLAWIGLGLLGVGALALATGALPASDAIAIAVRVAPVLAFVVAMTVVAGLATDAGLFDVLASRLARLSRGRTALLWLLVVLLAALTTAFLSLDTTAVLLTPVVIVVARANGLPPLPFALTTVWLANTASLLLPVSNLTNLLALHPLGFSDAATWFALLGPSALLAAAVPAVVAYLLYRRALPARFLPAPTPVIADRRLLIVCAIVVGLLLPALVSGLEPWIPTTAAAVVLVVAFAWRAPRSLRPSLLPWQLVVFAAGLFLTVGALEAQGSASVLSHITGTGDSPLDLLRVAAAGLIGSNAINNLPAYLALEGVAGSPERLAALLIGVNAGALITPWASLATLLWHDRLTAMGVEVRWARYAALGLVVAPLTVGLALAPLLLRAG